MTLTDAETARLAKLEEAYDKLISGSHAETIRFSDGREVSYGPGDLKSLRSEVDDLQLRVSGRGRSRGALRFIIR